jgi:hypothetical protein
MTMKLIFEHSLRVNASEKSEFCCEFILPFAATFVEKKQSWHGIQLNVDAPQTLNK